MNVNFRTSHLNFILNADKGCHIISDMQLIESVLFVLVSYWEKKSVFVELFHSSQSAHGAYTKVENT